MFAKRYGIRRFLTLLASKQNSVLQTMSMMLCCSQLRDEGLLVNASLVSGIRCFGGMQVDTSDEIQREIEDAVKIASLIERFRHRGHLCANLDPLQRAQRGPWMSESQRHTGR